jgi:Mrp family chromosome partitioning ATPase
VTDARSRFQNNDRIFAVVPELAGAGDADGADEERTRIAAYFVHRVRALLQIRQQAQGHTTFAVTSPTAGDGKTSLTAALGASFALSGARTLLIDCDMEGAGLSCRLAPGAAGTDGAAEGYRDTGPGLSDVLAGLPLPMGITPTGVERLHLLPNGSGPMRARLSPESLRRILRAARKDFDAILIDCGPALGSVEAAVAAAEADGVIVVFSRGGQRPLAEKAMSLLLGAGARVAGVVFNRARWEELSATDYSSPTSRPLYAGASRAAVIARGGPSASTVHADRENPKKRAEVHT